MRVTRREEAETLSRGDGLASTLLHSRADSDLTVTWVEVEPGAEQVVHAHDPEQVYVVLDGEGRMHVGGEERPVAAGDLVHIPPQTDHGVVNTGDEVLTYLSAATPAFSREAVEAFYDAGE